MKVYFCICLCMLASMINTLAQRRAVDPTGASGQVDQITGHTVPNIIVGNSPGWLIASNEASAMVAEFTGEGFSGNLNKSNWNSNQPISETFEQAATQQSVLPIVEGMSLPSSSGPVSLFCSATTNASLYGLNATISISNLPGTSGATNETSTAIKHSKAWLYAPPMPRAQMFTFIKITKVTITDFSDDPEVDPVITTDYEYDEVTVTIPARSMYSSSFELEPKFNEEEATLSGNTIKSKEIKFVPLEIAVVNTNGPSTGEGVLAKVGDVLRYEVGAVNMLEGLSYSNVSWQYRQIRGDGAFDVWESLGSNGRVMYNTETNAGIYQLKATVNTPDGPISSMYYKRAETIHARNSGGMRSGHAYSGQPEYVGVCSNQTNYNVCMEARSNLGSTAWAYDVPISVGYGVTPTLTFANTYKCNIFVFMMANRVGKTIPTFSPLSNIATTNNVNLAPPTLKMYDAGYAMNSWISHSNTYWPQPGDIVIEHSGDGYGHCGIMDYDGSWVNAGTEIVNKHMHLTIPTGIAFRFRN